MRVLFDARPGEACVTGIGRYARTVEGLQREGIPGHECWSLGATSSSGRLKVTSHSAQEEELELPAILERERIDLFHSPLFHLPAVLPCEAVITIHDAIPLARPDLASEGFTSLFAEAAEAACRSAAVVCPSQSAKRDLVGLMGLNDEKVCVIPETPAPRFRPMGPIAVLRVLARHGLTRGFLLMVGSLEKRKNPILVLDALAQLPASERIPLVAAGPQPDIDLELEAKERGLSEWVHCLGVVPDEDLVGLYNGAFALVFPSLYEGFGLPVVEAFACGTPVIASNAASLPEVVGDAGLLFDPEVPESLAERIRELRGSPPLREQLIQRAQRRLDEHFSPAAVRQGLAELYTRLELRCS